VRGTYETVLEGRPVALERWSVEQAAGATRLEARGEAREGRPCSWNLDVVLGPQGSLDALEWQLTPQPPPTEVTTIALRALGPRVFLTRIPPEGVAQRLETDFAPGALVVGPSLALLALLASRAPLQAGMGMRALLLRVDDRDLSMRLEDGILLQGKRVRGPGADGREGWVRALELRAASAAGRTQVAVRLDAAGVGVSFEWPQALPARSARLVAFER
jgi:hypothetical protein